ncbi:MAG: histidine--tRNA ligase [Capsulimonadaceae bacterium]
MGKYARPRGTHDVYPGATSWEEDSIRTNALESLFRKVCQTYGYDEVRTPIFESTDLFTRSIGAGTDIVNKEMYTFLDAGGRSMTLRPEGTAGVLRAYLDTPLHARGGVTKLFYIGPNFRYERPASGRYRQFAQFGVEALGSDDPALDAEVIRMSLDFFKRIGISSLVTKVNSVGSIASRTGYLAALKEYVAPYLEEFSEEGRARFNGNPLRMLDTKHERELEILVDAPRLTAFLSDEERAHLDSVCEYLADGDVAFDLDAHLVRGFDYYTKTAFEIQSPDLDAQNAIGGGGRYDKLVEELGGPPTPGIGFGIGCERTLIALQRLGLELPVAPPLSAFVVTLGDAARKAGVKLLGSLRSAGISADIAYGGRSMKAQMRAANDSHARYALILGDDEVAAGVVTCKHLASGEQESVAAEAVARLLALAQQLN